MKGLVCLVSDHINISKIEVYQNNYGVYEKRCPLGCDHVKYENILIHNNYKGGCICKMHETILSTAAL